MSDRAPDIGPDTGKRPDTAKPGDQELGKIGTGQGYSGQEYDSAGQDEWRRKQEERTAPADGSVHGSGAGAGGGDASEDYDVGTPGWRGIRRRKIAANARPLGRLPGSRSEAVRHLHRFVDVSDAS